MSVDSTTYSDVLDVLVDHRWLPLRQDCACGWFRLHGAPLVSRYRAEAHPVHVAEAVVATLRGRD